MALTNISQTVSFYNTKGVIDKHNNVYYYPSLTIPTGSNLAEEWLKAFKLKCTSPTGYSNLTLSNWSPEDRTLKVQGNVDDFRGLHITDKPLNYFILTRVVGTKTIHYGFFIDSVQQTGMNTVLLNVSQDYFTNVNFLCNTSVDTDPLQTLLQNTLVERKHLDRFSDTNVVRITDSTTIQSGWIPTTEVQGEVEFEGTVNLSDYNTPTGFTFISLELDTQEYSLHLYELDFNLVGSILHITGAGSITGQYEQQSAIKITFRFNHLVDEYNELTVSQDPAFYTYNENITFKVQLKDERKPLYWDFDTQKIVPLSDEDLEIILASTNIANESDRIQRIVISLCLYFYQIIAKESITGKVNMKLKDLQTVYPREPIYTYYGEVESKLTKYILPVYIVPNFLQDKRIVIDTFMNKVDEELVLNNYIKTFVSTNFSAETNTIIRKFKEYGLDQYIASIYLTRFTPAQKYITLRKNPNISTHYALQFNWTVRNVNPESNIIGNDYTGISVVPLLVPHDIEPQTTIDLEFNPNDNMKPTTPISLGVYTLFSELSYDKLEINVEDRHLFIRDTEVELFEPVLEANPYQFYTIDYLGINESPLNKALYTQQDDFYKINLFLFYSQSTALKIGVIPEYVINNKPILYYKESLVITLANQLPLTSDSYWSYYYSNQAQMKNQFAVNETHAKYGAIETAISGAGLIAKGAVKSGWAGAGMGAIDTLTSMANVGVNFAKQKEIITGQQNAVLTDAGNQPDVVRQSGSDIYYDLQISEMGFYLNHYAIDEVSYNNGAKYLERFGYKIDRFESSLDNFSRIGYNYIKIVSCDLNDDYNLTLEQEEAIRNILSSGITLLHEPEYLNQNTYRNKEKNYF